MGEHRINGSRIKPRIDRDSGGDPTLAELADDALRRMNHREWLLQFSQILGVSPNSQPGSVSSRYQGMPMTPFRAGAISRLAMAARYIALLEDDIARLTKENTDGR